MIRHLNIDLETFSSIDIKKSGLYKYVEAPDFQILLFGYSLDGAPTVVVDLAQGEKIPQEIMTLLTDPVCVKHAYNAPFEWYCLSHAFGLPMEQAAAWLPQWCDTMLHGLYCGYPAGLGATGAALGLPEDKRKLATGRSLIRTFCTPCKPTASNGNRTRTLPRHEPEKWVLFKEYNAQDVVTEQEIQRRLSRFPVPEDVQRQWVQDQVINLRGVAVDMPLVQGALFCSKEVTGNLTAEAVSLTGIENPKSVKQLLEWLAAETGEEVKDLKKETVVDMLEKDISSDAARRILEIRQELSKTSVKKYDAVQNSVCGDSRVRGLLQFYGANRTGRWAGRIVQVQNLPRTYLPALPLARDLVKSGQCDNMRMIYGSIPDSLSQLIRTAFVPAQGNLFVDADFSAIEARVIAWLSGEDWVLEVFRTHGKIYEACASQMFGVPLDKIRKGNPEYALRQRGKVATLALGYQGGTAALMRMDTSHSLNEEELPDIVRRWRRANRRICDLWYAVEGAVMEVMHTGRSATVNNLVFAREGDFQCGLDFLTIRLPSGRKLYYVSPFLAPDNRGGEKLYYWGTNQTTRKWEVTDTYGGKLVENITQAVARDCLAVCIDRLESAGYPVVFHVHDEVVLDVPKEKADLDKVCRMMGEPIVWAPGLPLKADGWVGEFYTKD